MHRLTCSPGRHADFHQKRANAMVTATIVENEIYYVMENGQTVSTKTETVTQSAAPVPVQEKDVVGGPNNNPTTYAAAPPATSASVDSPAPVSSQVAAPASSQTNPPAYPSPSSDSAPVSSAQPSTQPSGSGSGSSGASTPGLGVAYSPYTTGGDGCRDVEADIQAIVKDSRGFSLIRLYTASDCDVLNTVGKVITQNNSKMKVVLNPLGDKRQYDLDNLVTAFKPYLGLIDSVLVTNEAGSGASAATAATVSSYKQKWSGQPFSVAGAEAFGQMSPAVLEASDFCAVNIHAFQQPDCTGGSADAGNCIVKKMGQSTLGCGDKRVMVSESGWPSAGGAGYTASDQAAAIAALQKLPGSNKIDSLVLFMAYNDPTKGGAECEKHLGFMG